MNGMTEDEATEYAREYQATVQETIRMRNDLKAILINEKKSCNNVESEASIRNMEKTLEFPGIKGNVAAEAAIKTELQALKDNLAKNGEKSRDMFKNRNALLKCCEKEQLEPIEAMLDRFLNPKSIDD